MDKKIILLVLSFVMVASIFAFSMADTMYSNDLVHYMYKKRNEIPGGYTPPMPSQIEILRKAAWYILNSQFAGAVFQANAVNYNVKAFKDTVNSDSEVTYYILESRDPNHRPWGTYVFYVEDDAVDCAIEVPHPAEELNTTNIGVEIFTGSKAKALLLSGTKRKRCDVTKITDTVFEGIHKEVCSEGTDILQIDGFKKHSYPQVVMSAGSPVATQAMDKYVMELTEDFEVGIYNGTQYTELSAEDNVQAEYANGMGANFICFFLNSIVHNSKDLSDAFIELTETAISETSSSETSS